MRVLLNKDQYSIKIEVAESGTDILGPSKTNAASKVYPWFPMNLLLLPLLLLSLPLDPLMTVRMIGNGVQYHLRNSWINAGCIPFSDVLFTFSMAHSSFAVLMTR